LFSGALCYALNSAKIVCRPGSKWICWESLQRSPDSLDELRGRFAGEKAGRRRKERQEGIGREGKKGRAILPTKTKILAMAVNKDTRKLPV